jgi:4-amino-4-deoxy-L-arabinose transferase-like glycosyltransferase
MNQLHRNRAAIGALLALFVLVSLYALSIRALAPPDEGRYAEMAREMFVSGDWITTRLNGIKYFEKPPLQAWMNALSFAAFGIGEWQARLWTGLCGIFGVALTGYTGTRLFGARAGLNAALVLGSCFYWAAFSQIDSLDMGLSGTLTLSLCALLLAQREAAAPEQRRRWMLACWAGMALATLSKGLIGIVVPGAVLVLYAGAARDHRIWRRLEIGRGLLLYALVALPWFVLVGLKNPEQPHFFFVHEHLDRFLTKEHHREAAPWFFLALLALGSLPWLGMLGHSLAGAARRGPSKDIFRPRLLLLAWVGFIVVFFSLSSSKLPGYILPVFPALALLVGRRLEDASRALLGTNALLTLLTGAALLAVAPCAHRFGLPSDETTPFLAWLPYIDAAGLLLSAGGALGLWCARKDWRGAWVLVLAVAGFGATQLLLAGSDVLGRSRAGADLAPIIRSALAPSTRLYSVGVYAQSLTFYLGRPVMLAAYEDEFAFGLAQQPALAIATVPDFIEQWRRDSAAGVSSLAIVRPDIVADLRELDVPLRIVGADAMRTIIVNR